MIKYLNELKLFENKCLGLNNLIIIIGANIKEKHIQDFREKQKDMTIWCISEKVFTLDEKKIMDREIYDYEVVLENFTLKYENNVILHQLRFDFNNVNEWRLISKDIEQNYLLKKIIVDWSTTKFFKKEHFNFTTGEIMKIIREFINDHNTEFYSPCCFDKIHGIVQDGEPKDTPVYLPYFKYEEVVIVERNSLENEEMVHFVNTPYIMYFSEKFYAYNDIIHHSKYADQENFKEYPLVRSDDKEIKEYMVIKKIENK